MSEAPETMVLRAIVQLDEKVEALGRRVEANAETLDRLDAAMARLLEMQATQGRALAELMARQDLVSRALQDVQGRAE